MTTHPSTPGMDELRERLHEVLHQKNVAAGASFAEEYGHPELLDAIMAAVQSTIEQERDRARFELMVRVLLSRGTVLTITPAALHESLDNYEIRTRPSSTLNGGVVYSLAQRQLPHKPQVHKGKEEVKK